VPATIERELHGTPGNDAIAIRCNGLPHVRATHFASVSRGLILPASRPPAGFRARSALLRTFGTSQLPADRARMEALRAEVGRGSLFAGRLQVAGLFEAVIAAVADNDVIQHRNAEQFSRCDETPGDLEIIGRGCRIARRMHVALMCPESLCGRGQWERRSHRSTR
jgi:hypothetical protein